MYDVPLTLKTYVPASWKQVKIQQGKHSKQVKITKDEKGSYVIYQADPNAIAITLTKI
jgi:hypothetical protein